MSTPELPVTQPKNQTAWRDWLQQNHQHSPGVWVRLAKKNSGETTVSYAEAVEEALCFGWIDGLAHSESDAFYLQKFTPRRPKSVWSKINVGRTEKLIAAGKMTAAGQAAIDAAKADGRWEAAYASPATSVIPPDFKAALDKNPAAKAFYESLNKANTYAFCYRVESAKKPETRQARIEKFVAMLEKGQKLH